LPPELQLAMCGDCRFTGGAEPALGRHNWEGDLGGLSGIPSQAPSFPYTVSPVRQNNDVKLTKQI
jgi:hypothetical protein